MDSTQWFERACRVMPGGVNSPVRAHGGVGGMPRYVARAAGACLWDVEGRRYVDFVGSWGPMILGHAHPAVEAAARAALANGASFGACCPAEVELAERICAHVPCVERVRMTCSGTEAVMAAVRLARAYTGREVVVKFDGCYHGHSDGLLARAGSGLATQGLPGSAGVPASVAAATWTLPYNDIPALHALFGQAGDRIAAVLVEPVVANMGVVAPVPGFLETLRALTSTHGALLVFDEVITGFRLGLGGAQALYGITPDLATFGKIVGGGFPVGAYGGRRDIMELVAPLGPVYQAGTLAGNPVAMAAGNAQLQALAGDGTLYARLDALAERLAAGARTRAAHHGVPLTVNRVGSLLTLFFTDGPVRDHEGAKRSDGSRYARFFHHMLDAGYQFAPSPYEAAFLCAAHTEREIDGALDAMDGLFAEEAERAGNNGCMEPQGKGGWI